MPPGLLLPLVALSFTCLVVLLMPLAVGTFFPVDGDRLFRNTLCRLLTYSMCEGTTTMAAVVANYAFLSGMMLSLVAGKTSTALSTTTSNTIPHMDAASPLVSFAQHVVSMAFDQGYRLRFSWPPAQLYASSSLRPL
ncbi:hypothetical protein CMQ_4179 [Grosmannia clavigera kw1407]|uniref:Uncharacterized protein n=1 Tax=Grosmannia clavigera (strain kw1407 / UAMH 11150) TaxID=655863 RepID=F0X933_GROCL|nr:uncharacterized protein CMQ_4179 [Grosmannia clavigera kw1407]EFX06110.1 hypothetical protein CMQ_4179 [Grosmannia clavigera kw1407]